jgi:isopentenyl-diphosphate Delta-isomerase
MVAPRKTSASVTPLDHTKVLELRSRNTDASTTPAHDIEQRKKDHIDIILSGAARHGVPTGFDDVHFEHCALPDIDLDAIDLSSDFLGKTLRLPFLASSMTGGPEKGGSINLAIAEAAQAMGFAMGVGSQRIALGGGKASGLDKSIRRVAPDIALFANLGAVQFTHGMTVDDARRAVELIEADALILHLNPLQEALQPGGDRNWAGVAKAIETICRQLPVPVIAKEVGAGISVSVAEQLLNCGVSAIDVAGVGGSSWAAVEGMRQNEETQKSLAELFRNWGIPTARALVQIHAALPDVPLIASGGIRHGLDGAKALRLGARLVGQAGPLLEAATRGVAAVAEHVETFATALRIACFCTGAANLDEIRRARLQTD